MFSKNIAAQGTAQLNQIDAVAFNTKSTENYLVNVMNTNEEKHTRNGWRRLGNTIETSREDGETHSKRVEKMEKHNPNECK